MPEYLIAIVLTAVMGGFGFVTKRISVLDDRLDDLHVKLAEEYVQKPSLDRSIELILNRLDRFEDKLDAAYRVENERLLLIKQSQLYKDNKHD